MCTYHGWTYDLKGALVGVPGFKEVYHEELDRENWGLIKARTETYHGFIFANLDPEAPDLDEYLGEVGRISIDQLTARGNLICAPGIQKWVIDCNWKFAVDNVWDFYHTTVTHSRRFSWAMAAGQPAPTLDRDPAPVNGLVSQSSPSWATTVTLSVERRSQRNNSNPITS